MAARSVGEVSATLSADTRKFVSEVKRVTDKAENEEVDINVGAEVDEADLQRAVQQVQDAVDRAEADLDIGADVSNADVDAALDDIRQKIDSADTDVAIGGEINTDDLEAALADVEEHIASADSDVSIGGEIDNDDLDEALRRIGIKVEDLDLSVGIGGEIDLADLDAALDEIQGKVDRAQISADIGGNPALADLDAALADIDVYVSAANIEASIGGNVDLFDLDAALADIGVRVEASHFAAPIGGEIDWVEVDRALGLIEGEVEVRNPDVDIGGAKNHFNVEAALDEVELEVAARSPDVNIGAEVDTTDKAFATVESEMTSWAAGAGKSGGKSYGSGFSGALSDGSQLLIGAIVALGTDAATALEGALGGATAIISHAVEAAAGSAGALVGIGVGVGAALAAVYVGASGVRGALKDVNTEIKNAKEEGRTIHLFSGPVGDALAQLTPNAQAFAVAWADTHGSLQDVKADVQEALFAGLSTELTTLSQETIPDVGGALVIAAGWANLLFTNLSHVAQDVDFTGIAEGLSPAMTNIVDAVTSLASSFGPLLEEVSPAAEELAGWLEDGADALANYVISNPEKMTKFFDDGVTKLEQWGRLLGAAASLLGTIIHAASPTGGSALDALTGTLDRWETFLSGDLGQAKLDAFFGGVETTWQGMDPLFQGLKEAWSILTEEGTAESFNATMTALGDAMPAIAEALGIMGDVGLASAFSNIIQTFEPFLHLIGQLPDELLASIGQMYAWYKTVKLMDSAVDGLLKTISAAQKNPWMLAIAAALTVATVAMDFFGSKQDDAREATDQFGDSLQTAIAHIVGAQDAADGSTAAMQAMDAAFLDTTKNNVKVTDAMLKLGIGTDGAAQSLLNLHSEGAAADAELERLAENVLGNKEAAEGLAAIVGHTDDNFSGLTDRLGEVEGFLQSNNIAYDENADSIQELADSSGQSIDSILTNVFGMKQDIARDFADLAESTGIPIDSLLDLSGAMEEMSDQGEKVDFQSIAKEQLTLAATGDEASQAMFQAALDAQGLSGSFDEVLSSTTDLVPLFQEYINQLYGTADAQDAANAAALGGLTGQEFVNGMIEDQIALQKEKAEETRAAAAEEYRAWRDTQRAAEQALKAVQDVATADFGLPPGAAKGLSDYGKAADDAAASADALTSSLDTLLGRFLDSDEAFDNAQQSLSDLTEQTKGYTTDSEGARTAIENWTDSLIDNSDGARDNRAAVRDSIRAMFDYAESATNAGDPIDEITSNLDGMRQALIEQVGEFDTGTQSAEEYVDALLGTPGVLETIVKQPDMLNALLNADELTVKYDAMGKPIITEFEQLGLDSAILDTEGFQELLDFLGITVVYPTVSDANITPATHKLGEFDVTAQRIDGTTYTPYVSTMQIEPATEAVQTTEDTLNTVDGMVAEPSITVPGVADAIEDVDEVQGDLDTLDTTVAEPSVTVPGVDDAISGLDDTQGAVDDLDASSADPGLSLTDQINMIHALGTVAQQIKALNDMVADPTLKLTDYIGIVTSLHTLQTEVKNYDTLYADPNIQLTQYGVVHDHLNSLISKMRTLDGMSADPRITLPGIWDRIHEVERLQTEIDQLHGRTVTITTHHVATGTDHLMAGGIVGAEGTYTLGERGMREAVVPLDLPLSRVDPSVRELAALLRGQTIKRTSDDSGPRVQVNQVIQPLSADPVDVSIQVVNRIAALIS